MMKSLLSLASPAGPRGRLSILIFHRVRPQADELYPEELDAHRFQALCSWVNRWFNVLPLDAAVRALRNGTLPARAAALTFDDGYADNHDVAMPILKRLGLPCTFFVATGFLNGGRMWNDTIIEAFRRTPRDSLSLDDLVPGLGSLPCGTPGERRRAIDLTIDRIKYLAFDHRRHCVEQIASRSGVALADDLMMTDHQVRGLRDAGMQIGAHTVNHPILAKIESGEAWDEITQSKQRLEQLLQRPVTLFAYPNGRPNEDFGRAAVELVRRAGFEAAFSTAWGAAGPASDPLQLPRFTPWERTPVRFGLRMAQNLWTTPRMPLEVAA